MTEVQTTATAGATRQSKGADARKWYPWTVWQDGEWHVLTQGTDFRGNCYNFTRMCKIQARDRRLKVETEILDGDQTVKVRFTSA